ncbi:MAG: transposase [Bryobacteraceae bacterium]
MARKPRFFVPGAPHHVTQRGNHRLPVFDDDRDRECWLDRFFEAASGLNIKVLAYCLMTNHIHVVLTPPEADSISRLMRRIQADYARAVNYHRGTCGHLWHSRYYACPMSEVDALVAMAYVERNPVRAGMVRYAWEYRWSSAHVHVRGVDDTGRLDLSLWAHYYPPERWKEVLRLGIKEEAWQARFREATRRGLPLGSDEYVRSLSERFERDLAMRPVGRPSRKEIGRSLVAGDGR